MYITFTLAVEKAFALKNAYHLPPVTSAAVVKSLMHFGVEKQGNLQIKFVNDVFLNGKKLCGVLSRIESQGDAFKLIVGVGVNLNTLPGHYPDLNTATSVLIETGRRISISEFTEVLTTNFVNFLELLRTQGFQGEIHQFLASQMYLLGKCVKIYDRNLTTVTLEGVFEYLNDDGTVTIKDSAGKTHVINDGRMRAIDF